jgi:hypothetical protein
MSRRPNKAHPANPAMTSLFHAGRQWRRVADARRWPMKLFCLTLPLLATVLTTPGTVLAEDYAGYAALPEIERDRIVWNLHEYRQWGLPEQKPICRDLLETQGHSFANQIAWTTDAIDLAQKQGWKDLSPLIAKIYERPKNIWVYERAFRYLRSEEGKLISTNIVAAADILGAAGHYRSAVSDEQLSAAKERLVREADKEAIMVYALNVAGWHAGKGGTDRGRKAAADVLKGLDRETVTQRLRQLRQGMGSEIEWVANYLGISLEDHRK